MTKRIPTDEQMKIINFGKAGKGSLVIDALAGTGKTETLMMMLSQLPQKSVLLCAFNTRIADELRERLPRVPGSFIQVKTFHAQGLALIKEHYRHLEVSKTGTEDMLRRAAGSGGPLSFRIKRSAVNVLRTLKETTASRTVPTSAEVLALGYEYDHFDKKMTDREKALAVDLVRDAYLLSLDLASRQTIDYCDMVWAPLACELEPRSRYQAVLVDEYQDISGPQLAMLRKLMAPGARFIGVGDVNQQIYDWRGSLGKVAWSIAREQLKATFLPLTMTWRCAKMIVAAANNLVPALRARKDAPEGSVDRCAWHELSQRILADSVPFTAQQTLSESYAQQTFVLSRNNAVLLECALFLWRQGTQFELNAGKEMLEPLFELLDNELDLRDESSFRASLNAWHAKVVAAAEKANAPSAADRADEYKTMLSTAVGYTEPTGIKRLLYDIISPNSSGVLLSTVHKVKGLEADRVFLLEQTFARHQPAQKCKFCNGTGECTSTSCNGGYYTPEIEQEELNIEYVAITRARMSLIWVDIDARVPNVHPYDPNESEEAAAGQRRDIKRMLGDAEFDDQRHPDDIKAEIDVAADIELDKLVRPRAAAMRKQFGIKTEAEQLLEASRRMIVEGDE